MGFRMSEVSQLKINDPTKWRQRVRISIHKQRGNLGRVAQDLDVGLSTLKRWLQEDPKLNSWADKCRRQNVAAA